MSKPELIIAKKLIYTFIIIVAIVEFIIMFNNVNATVHLFSMFVIGVGVTVFSFVRKDVFKWCELTFTLVYLLLTICSIILV